MFAYTYNYCLLLSMHDHCLQTQCRQVAALEAELADAEENAKVAQNKYRKEVRSTQLFLCFLIRIMHHLGIKRSLLVAALLEFIMLSQPQKELLRSAAQGCDVAFNTICQAAGAKSCKTSNDFAHYTCATGAL
jgi:hypothetical protein